MASYAAKNVLKLKSQKKKKKKREKNAQRSSERPQGTKREGKTIRIAPEDRKKSEKEPPEVSISL